MRIDGVVCVEYLLREVIETTVLCRTDGFALLTLIEKGLHAMAEADDIGG